jgi:hypothetical protein
MKMNTKFGLIVLFAFGMAVGVAITCVFGPFCDVRVHVLEGYINAVNQDGTAIGITIEPGGQPEAYIIAGATWREHGGPWSDKFPTCLEPLTSGQKVRLGVVYTAPTNGGPGRPVVVWLECLD